MRPRTGIRRVFRLPSTTERLARDLDEEVVFHVEARVARLIAAGMSYDEARAEALRLFGDVNDLRDYCHDIERAHMQRMQMAERIGGVLQDVRVGIRQFRKSPGFSLAAAFTLALGIGATTALFSVVNGVLLKALPFPAPDRLVQVTGLDAKGNVMRNFADPTFDAVATRNRSLSAVAEVNSYAVTVSNDGEALRLPASWVSKQYFDVLGMKPAAGRFFVPDEQQLGAAKAAVISYSLWQRLFAGSNRALGAKLANGSATITVVGVLPKGLEYPAQTDIFLARETEKKLTSYTAHNWRVLARVRPGVTIDQARLDVSSVLRRLRAEVADLTITVDGGVTPLQDQIVGQIRPILLLLFGAACLLLLIACTNVVNLLVARMAVRESELAVRVALGAGRGRLVQQLLVEASLLSMLGCFGGLALAFGGVKLLLALRPTSIPRLSEVSVDWRVMVFAIAVSITAAVALGLVAAWRGMRGDLRAALSQSQRSQGGGAVGYGMRSALVVVQLSMTVVLMVATGVLGRSFLRLMSTDAGFRTHGVAVVTLVAESGLDNESDNDRVARRSQLVDDALSLARSAPGVTAVGGVSNPPISGGGADGTFLVLESVTEKLQMSDMERLFQDKSRTGEAYYRTATGDYFKAMGIPLLSGRVFDDRDRRDAPHVAVINASLAKSQWPSENPIGKVIEFGNMDGDLTPMTIVGVVGDVRDGGPSTPVTPMIYTSYRQRPGNGAQFSVVMVASDPGTALSATRRELRRNRPDVPASYSTMDDAVASSVTTQRFMLTLVGVFGAVALLLATLGVYSVISYLVAQRGREISIRVALGARGSDIVGLIIRQGVVLAVIGALVGVAGALAATRLLTHVLYEISASDPVAFGGVVAILAIVAVVASYIPARRAARIEPMDVLRGG
jgi:putative ABC transport system permease protein